MSTATAERCGHRWLGDYRHRCAQPANHRTTVRCRCRCGATTTRPTEGD